MARSQNGGSSVFNPDEGGDYVVPYLHTCWDSLITVQPAPFGPGMGPPMPQGTTYYVPHQLPPNTYFPQAAAGPPHPAGNWMPGQFPIEGMVMNPDCSPMQPPPVPNSGEEVSQQPGETSCQPVLSTLPDHHKEKGQPEITAAAN